MPVWHARTEKLVEEGKLHTLGIVEEQHPDRAVLFMQWQKMDWPVLADPFNRLGVKVVPITLLLDSSGIIRYRNPSGKDLETFLATRYPQTRVKDLDHSFDPSLEARQKEVKKMPSSPIAHFQLGVALRQRHDSENQESDDFAAAVASWQKALELQPDQYIWRRRIQQYGPRLDKPYSFYDWVNTARAELKKAGEIPHPLTAEPGGSEFAYPEKDGVAGAVAKHPDPEGKVPLDGENFVSASSVVVPSTKGDGGAIRVHLRFKPAAKGNIHWTNDAGNVSFHLEVEGGLVIHDFQGPGEPPQVPASAEERKIEFELRPAKGEKLPAKIKGTAYYYVCEGEEGVCRFLRQPVVFQNRSQESRTKGQ